MTIVAVNDVGALGLIEDVPEHELPLNAFSRVENISFKDAGAAACLGMQNAWATPPSVVPWRLLLGYSGSTQYVLYLGLQKAYVIGAGVHTNITRQTLGSDVNYTGGEDSPWVGGSLSGVPICSNGVDEPQMWYPVSPATKMSKLANWPVNTLCKGIRPFREFLVAFNVTKSGTNYPALVKWSHPADPGTVPVSWDETSTLYATGEYDLSDTPGTVLDVVPLRDYAIVYKDDSIYGMQYVGGLDVFRFFRIFSNIGLLAPHCAVEYQSGKHFIVSQDDIIVHDGQNSTPIASKRIRRWFFSQISSSSVSFVFVALSQKTSEVWLCFPSVGGTSATQALTWNWETGAWGYRQLPQALCALSGAVETQDTTEAWDSDANTWDSDITNWGVPYGFSGIAELLLGTAEMKLFRTSYGNLVAGNPLTVELERTGLGIPMEQGAPPDITAKKFFRRLWPRIQGTAGGAIFVEAGVQQTVGAAVTWLPGQTFIIGQTDHIDFRGTGRLLAVRFSSSSDIEWQLLGYEIDVTFGGKF